MLDQKKMLYSKEHEWIYIEGQSGTMGITDFAVEQLGDVVYVELPEIGAEAEQNVELCSIESSKAASDIFAPANGKVTEVNTALNDNPEKVNEDPFGDGWICKLDVHGMPQQLMDYQEYKDYLETL